MGESKAAALEKRLREAQASNAGTLEQVDLRLELAWELGLEDTIRSRDLSREALSVSEELNYAKGRALAHRNLSYCCLAFTELDDALDFADRALRELRELGDRRGESTVRDILCHTYLILGSLPRALDNALEGLNLCRQAEYRRGEAYALHNLGMIYAELEENEQARRHYNLALDLFREIDYPVGESWVLARMGNLHLKLKRDDEALSLLRAGRELAAQHGISMAAARASIDIADIHRRRGDTRSALRGYLRNLRDFRVIRAGAYGALNLLALAELYLDLGELDKAERILARALREGEANDLKPVLHGVHLALSRLYESRGLHKQALEHFRVHHELKEVVFDQETRIRMKNMQIRFKVEAAENEAELKRLRLVEKSRNALRKAHGEVRRLRDRLKAENNYLRDEISSHHNFDEIITADASMAALLKEIERVAPTAATVLITGESGTGKELLARAVHALSARRDRPLVKLNCASLPADLVESELFGHEKGAFTGAHERRRGRFELAHRGTILLDEIGEMPPLLQAKLLRVLQEGEFERLGSSRTIQVDVRVIAATNRHLEQAVREGSFREDLYYRLNVFPVHSPPLRERRADIPLLARHFTKRFAARAGKTITAVPEAFLEKLSSYHWPGNVRELENVIERSVILSTGSELEPADLVQKPGSPANRPLPTWPEQERRLIETALQRCRWVIKGPHGAARMLDIPASTLREKIKKYSLVRPADLA